MAEAAEDTPPFRITTLGSFDVRTADGRDVLESRSARHVVLKYLVARPDACAPSADLAFALGTDDRSEEPRSEDARRLQLRVEVSALRKRFAKYSSAQTVVTARRDGVRTVALATGQFSRDYVELEAAAAVALERDDPDALRAALERWTGVFLPGDERRWWVRDVRLRVERTVRRVAARALRHPELSERTRRDVADLTVRFLRDIAEVTPEVEAFALDVIDAIVASGERRLAKELADHFAGRVSAQTRDDIEALFDASAGAIDIAAAWAAIAPAGAPSYVGRRELFASIRTGLTAPDRLARGMTVVIAGPHGSGRTRTALELLDLARRARGAIPIRLSGSDSDGTATLSDAFTTVVERAGPAFRVHDAMLANQNGARDPERAPHVFARVLYALAIRRPVALALDDFDDADATLDRFARLAERRSREVPIFFFLTARVPLSARVTAFVAEHDDVVVHALPVLEPDEALALATATAEADGTLDAATIAARSGGNPRFIVESRTAGGELSPAFKRRLLERLDACGERERETFLAVCSEAEGSTPAALARRLNITRAQVFDRLEALLALHFVHERGDQFVADPLLAAVARNPDTSCR